MTKPLDIGPNRTGIGVAPLLSKEAVESAREGVPVASFDTRAHHEAAVSWAKNAEPLGTLPPPASIKGVATAALEALRGKRPTVLLDELGERLAFERTGVRLYEALLCRYDASEPRQGSPTRSQIERIHDEELAHFHLAKKALESLGADPTAVTPGADVVGVAGSGLLKILSDPRTTLTEGLKAILVAELADNDGWSSLVRLAKNLGHDEMAADFKRALEEEEDHLTSVRAWLDNAIQGQARATPPLGPEPVQPQPGA